MSFTDRDELSAKLVVIGCGWMTEFGHAPALLRSDRVEVVGVADYSAERAFRIGQMLGVPAEQCFADYQNVLEMAEADAVIVATPPDIHPEVVIAAANAGKHVLCEKPIAPTLAEADAMIEACRAAGVMLGMCHNCLWFPEYVEARRLIEAGTIGEVYATEISGIGGEVWAGADEYRPGWRRDVRQSGGGVLIDDGVHLTYLIESFHGGPIEAVSAFLRVENELDTWASCQLRLGNGIGTLNVAWAHGGATLSIVGTEGYLSFVYDEAVGSPTGYPVRIIRVHREGEPSVNWYRPRDKTEGWVSPRLYDDFVAGIRGERVFPALGEDARRQLEVVAAAYQSHSEGRVVLLPLTSESVFYGAGALGLGAVT